MTAKITVGSVQVPAPDAVPALLKDLRLSGRRGSARAGGIELRLPDRSPVDLPAVLRRVGLEVAAPDLFGRLVDTGSDADRQAEDLARWARAAAQQLADRVDGVGPDITAPAAASIAEALAAAAKGVDVQPAATSAARAVARALGRYGRLDAGAAWAGAPAATLVALGELAKDRLAGRPSRTRRSRRPLLLVLAAAGLVVPLVILLRRRRAERAMFGAWSEEHRGTFRPDAPANDVGTVKAVPPDVVAAEDALDAQGAFDEEVASPFADRGDDEPAQERPATRVGWESVEGEAAAWSRLRETPQSTGERGAAQDGGEAR